MAIILGQEDDNLWVKYTSHCRYGFDFVLLPRSLRALFTERRPYTKNICQNQRLSAVAPNQRIEDDCLEK